MAMTYLHRILVTGAPPVVRKLARDLTLVHRRRVGKTRLTETIPFSFERLYELAPAARRVFREVPYEPYDVLAWPPAKTPSGESEARYQFTTRGMEMLGLVRALSRAWPTLTFKLVTACADDSSFESHRIVRGRVRTWVLPDKLNDAYWEVARHLLAIKPEADIYDDLDAASFVDEAMLDAALAWWEMDGRVDDGRALAGPRSWWEPEVVRSLEDERAIVIAELSREFAERD